MDGITDKQIQKWREEVKNEREELFGGFKLNPKMIDVPDNMTTSSEALCVMRVRENSKWMRDMYNDD